MKMIWSKSYNLLELNEMRAGTILEALDIEFTELGADFLKASMPVDHRTVQPAGILHGGANVVLTETLGSLASTLIVDNDRFYCVGLEVNANHVRPGLSGHVHGKATPIHLGKSTHIWHIIVNNDEGKLVCVSRLTIAVKPK